jgi:hypothetical protein
LNKAGIVMKTALIGAVYKKSLKVLQPSGKTIRSRRYTISSTRKLVELIFVEPNIRRTKYLPN